MKFRETCEVDRPPREALEKAAHFLCRIGALDTKDVPQRQMYSLTVQM